MKNLLIALTFCLSFNAFSQFYKTYDWETAPSVHQLNEAEELKSSVGILKNHIVEYFLDESLPQPIMFETEHTITRVNDEKGIGQHNRVYIPMYQVEEVIDIKARTVTADGKTTLLNKDNIKEMKNVEEYGDFKIFAIEGVEKNSEIEVLYTVKKGFDMYGAQAMQSDYPIKQAKFIFIPNGLGHNVKAYRTKEEFKTSSIEGVDSKVLNLENIPAMVEEEYSTPKANNIEVVYQCFPKGQHITQNMFWSNVANNVGIQIFSDDNFDSIKLEIENITNGKDNLTEFEKAMRLDNYIKANYSIIKNNNEELTNLKYILENKTASDFGIMKIYSLFLSALDVEHQIVVTANRFQVKFDPDFFLPSMLREFLVYLPTEKKYIAPSWLENRVGEAPFALLGNYGMFIDKDMNYELKKIEQADADYSRIKREMDINFEDEWEYATVKEYQEYYGNWANTNRAVLGYSSEQGIEQFKDYLTGSGIADKDITEYEVKNTDLSQTSYNVPFVVSSTINSESLLEDAGDSFIFQIGKVIGTQSELYQETERINPIEMQYPNRYNYTIKVNIPEGYEVEGLNSLKIDKSYKDDNGDKLAKFQSDYNLKGNKLIVTIEEFYRTNEFDLDRYEEFRTVINAASDFNKASLLFSAKN